jgi:hypothetical protein
MNINQPYVTKIVLSDLNRLDPITAIFENIKPSKGIVTITCYGKAWTAFWGSIPTLTIEKFFINSDISYLIPNLSSIKPEIYNDDKLRELADVNDIPYDRDDLWNDYKFMSKMYGDDPYNWHSSIAKKTNPEYTYLRRIIESLKIGLTKIELNNQIQNSQIKDK